MLFYGYAILSKSSICERNYMTQIQVDLVKEMLIGNFLVYLIPILFNDRP